MRLKVIFYASILLASQLPGMIEAAEGSVVVDAGSGVVLLSKNLDSKKQVASLTKVATALVALKCWMKTKSLATLKLL